MELLIRSLESVNRVVCYIVRWATLLMVLIQFGIVLLRYVFGISFIKVDESVLYLHSAVFMLGAGYTLLVDDHVRVDIFYAKASAATRSLINIFGHLFLLIPSMTVILYWSWPSVRSSWRILEGAVNVGGIPASFLLKTLIPAFCLLLIVQSLACLLREALRLQDARRLHKAAP